MLTMTVSEVGDFREAREAAWSQCGQKVFWGWDSGSGLEAWLLPGELVLQT